MKLRFLGLIDYNRPGFATGVMSEAAPYPLLGLQNQTPPNGIVVHVEQLFHAFLFGEHDEIIEATLPNVAHSNGCTPERVCPGTGLGAKFA